MAIRTTYSAESWDRIYQAFSDVSFVSYDFDSIKEGLINYVKTYYPESFNDYVASSEFIAMLEMFAYIAEQIAYRVDMVAHENFITTAQRKASILKLAKLISYKATRNIPVRGLVKINSISTTERIVDSRGIDLSGLTITWNDPNNSNWKEQFILVMNRILNSRYGNPQKTFQIGDVVMDLYALKNDTTSLKNGVYPYTASAGIDDYPMEIVPADLDSNGPFEREPDLTSPLSIIYANDGIGDGSDYTGFLAFTKQGVLTRIDYNIADQLPDRKLELLPTNVNHTDVWVQRVDTNDNVTERWVQVDTIAEQNLVFNDDTSTRKKYEVDTLENDQISILFGDGDFSDAPQGLFRFWMRQSANKSIVIQKNKVVNVPMSFTYTATSGSTESCSLTFSLTTTLQNGSATETIEHIRRSAPSTYYAQNRMVNGQDYNTYLLKDPSILKLSTINRTFAGQPKYIDWNDASGSYENVKMFGDDATMRHEISIDSQTTSVSGQALIDSIIEPMLSTNGVINTLIHISASDPLMAGVVSPPRRKFIEDNRGARYLDMDGANVPVLSNVSADGSLKEKTAIQGLIDRHWYGEPLEYVQDSDGNLLARIPDPDDDPTDDSRIYAATVPRTIDGVNKFPAGDVGSGLQPIAEQDYFALRYNRYFKGIGNGTITIEDLSGSTDYFQPGEVWTIEVQADEQTLAVRSSTRGSFPTGTIGQVYRIQPDGFQVSVPFFTVTQGSNELAAGDAFILDTDNSSEVTVRSSLALPVNLNGWWEILSYSDLVDYDQGISSENYHQYKFDPLATDAPMKQHSWIIFIKKIRQQPTQNVIGYEVHSRDLKLTVESDTTKFWYNNVDQLLDSDTNKVVYDAFKVLRSNIPNGQTLPLGMNQTYDVVGAIKDDDGVIDVNKLEIVPTDMLQEDSSGDLIPDRLLQFENFAGNYYEYFNMATPATVVTTDPSPGNWTDGSFVDDTLTYSRRLMANNNGEGLDFMWQHFTPYTNITDPSPSNIHDAYVMTRGYYDNVISYVRGITTSAPSAPTPLELRNSYGYLLNNKMLSDTVILHPGKIRLLFGNLAEPQFRAKFKVVKSGSGSLTNERIKEEILNVINTYFDIDGWDFGDTFYATKLISLIHQRLPVDVASVVLVPVYSTNSFGSLFTVESGFDEILQSAAELSDIEIVDALTPTVIRQVI